MAYVDGFEVPVPKDRLAAYRTMARKAGKVWREHGALDDKWRRDRTRTNAAVMQDTRLKAMMDPKTMPFDAKRMLWGGFKTLVRL